MEILQFEGEESIPKMGEDSWGRVHNVVLHFVEKLLGKDALLRKKKALIAFQGEESLTPSPLRIALYLGEESLNPSPCGEGFVGRDSYAFRGEETP